MDMPNGFGESLESYMIILFALVIIFSGALYGLFWIGAWVAKNIRGN